MTIQDVTQLTESIPATTFLHVEPSLLAGTHACKGKHSPSHISVITA